MILYYFPGAMLNEYNKIIWWWCNSMEKIRKGSKAKYTGYLLTTDEYKYYKNLENKINKVLEKWDEYKEQYDLLI